MLSKRTDLSIQRDVLRELSCDPRLAPAEVGVEVDRGVVTLTGCVASWTRKLAAQEAAHRVDGVRDVANDVHVRGPGDPLTDTELAQAVRAALADAHQVPHEQIHVSVADGCVTLTGHVTDERERIEAEEALVELDGVRAVINLIDLRAN